MSNYVIELWRGDLTCSVKKAEELKATAEKEQAEADAAAKIAKEKDAIADQAEAEAKEAIFSFKLITRLFINTGEWFKQFLGCLMKKLGCYEKYYSGSSKKYREQVGWII